MHIIPSGCSIRFDAIVIYTKYPVSPEYLKNGKAIRIKNGMLFPKTNVSVDGIPINIYLSIVCVKIYARRIKKIRQKIRGSKQHHKFAYKIEKGKITC